MKSVFDEFILDSFVDKEMMANPKRVPYFLGLSDVPGKFLLVYRLGIDKPTIHEVICFSKF